MCVTEYSDLFSEIDFCALRTSSSIYLPHKELPRMAREVWHSTYAINILHGRRSFCDDSYAT